MIRRRFIIVCLCLAACSSAPPTPDTQAPRPPRGEITQFTLEGRLGLRQGGHQASVNLRWQHQPQHDDLFITTVLGQGVAKITRAKGNANPDDDGALLTTADGHKIIAADWQELAARVFGVDLPLDQMTRWMLADVPAAAVRATDEKNRPLEAGMNGWEVRYTTWESAAANALPTFIEIHGVGEAPIELRLKIDAWQVSALVPQPAPARSP